MEKDVPLPNWSYVQIFKKHVRGVAPQHLIDTITRHKIYRNYYWQQYCFGLNLVSFVDRVQHLQGIGGLFGIRKQPSNFLCLFLKLLELEPSDAVIEAFLRTQAWQMKYLRLLAALYIRFTYDSEKVRLFLEPLVTHYNRVAVLTDSGYEIQYFDEIIYKWLTEKLWLGITLPPLVPRENGVFRYSPLSSLRPRFREEVYEELGMTPDGQLIEKAKEKKRLRLKNTKIHARQPKIHHPTLEDEIAAENALRALLGLKPLK